MRQVIDPQREFGQVDIADIVFDPKSRDDIPPRLRGLQHLYLEPAVRERILPSWRRCSEHADGEGPARSDTGRPGMPQWTILVLGTLRLGLNADYDRIQELANQHTTLRQMLAMATGPMGPTMSCKPSRTTSPLHAGVTQPDQSGSRAFGPRRAKKKPGRRPRRPL